MFLYLGKKMTGKKRIAKNEWAQRESESEKRRGPKGKKKPKKKEKVQTGRPGIFPTVQILTIQKKKKTQGQQSLFAIT